MNENDLPSSKIVIAHRGASGYLPEHTLACKSLAYGMGADYLEQDVVLSKDHHPVVLHDIHVDTVTDVAKRFPDRRRDDGRFYAIDLTLAELKSLKVMERFNHESGKRVYPSRFPLDKSFFQISTLREEIELIQGLNASTGRNVGIYPEIKKPAWHRSQGADISKVILNVLLEYGYNDKSDRVFLQCFDADENIRVRDELDCHLSIVQLIGDNRWSESKTDYAALLTAEGLDRVAKYADAIGPWMNQVVGVSPRRPGYEITDLVQLAHQRHLAVHPYTLRQDDLPEFVDSFDRWNEIALFEADADGVFSDFPDRTVQVRNRLFPSD